MPDQAPDKRPHLVLHDPAKPIAFTAHNPKGGASKIVPDLPRQQHGKSLQDQLGALKPVAAAALAKQRQQGLESGLGLHIQFVGQPDVELAFESLADTRGCLNAGRQGVVEGKHERHGHCIFRARLQPQKTLLRCQ